MQQTILIAEPKKFPPPVKGLKKTLYFFIKSVTFTKFIQLIMILNLISCSFHFDGQDSRYKEIIDLFRIFYTCIYFTEMILKVIVFGIHGYFTYTEHKFQFFILIAMFFNVLIDYGSNSFFEMLGFGEKITRMLLILKVFGVLRIIGELPNIKNMLTVLMFSWKYILNIMLLLISSYFVFAIIGCNLFKEVTTGKVINEYVNFKNIFYALMTLFKCTTGDDWGSVMFDLNKIKPNCTPEVDCGSSKNFLLNIKFSYI